MPFSWEHALQRFADQFNRIYRYAGIDWHILHCDASATNLVLRQCVQASASNLTSINEIVRLAETECICDRASIGSHRVV